MLLQRLVKWVAPAVAASVIAFAPSITMAAGHGGGGHGGGGHGGGGHGGGGGYHGGYNHGGYNHHGFYGPAIGLGVGYPYGYGGYGYAYGPNYYYDTYPGYAYTAPDMGVYGSTATAPAQSFYNGPALTTDTAAQVTVTLPASGNVWFGDYQTTQESGSKAFQTPALTPGKTYSYDVRAKWMENGREVNQTRTVTIHAGDRVNVNFNQPNG